MNLIKRYPVSFSLMLLILLFTVLFTQSLESEAAKEFNENGEMLSVSKLHK